jgi:Domain of unknown function (DUF5658)
MGRSVVAGLMVMSCVYAMPTRAAAQETFEHSGWTVGKDAQAKSVSELPELSVRMMVPAGGLWQTPVRVRPASRGAALPAMYVSLIGLQAYDGYSTTTGLNHGAVESNGFMSAVVNHPASLWAVKGGAAFASIYMAERLWRQHRRGQAIALMVATNVVMASVAVSNASIIRAQK